MPMLRQVRTLGYIRRSARGECRARGAPRKDTIAPLGATLRVKLSGPSRRRDRKEPKFD